MEDAFTLLLIIVVLFEFAGVLLGAEFAASLHIPLNVLAAF